MCIYIYIFTIGIADFGSSSEAKSDSNTGYHEKVIDLRNVNLSFIFARGMNDLDTRKTS